MQLGQWFKSKTDGSNYITVASGNSLCAYSFTQTTASTDWVIEHNNNSIIIAIQVFIDNELVEPDEIVINSPNVFTVKFSSEVSGVVNFMLYKTGSVDDCAVIFPSLTPDVTPTPTETISAVTPTPTITATNTVTPTPTVTASNTVTPTVTPTSTIPVTPTVTPTNTATPTQTATPTVTPTVTPTPVILTPLSTGYSVGGLATQIINAFPFTSPFVTSSDIGNLAYSRSSHGSHSSPTNGFVSGGSTPFRIDAVDSFPFSSPFTTASVVGYIGVPISVAAGVNSTVDGYTVGGVTTPTNIVLSTVKRFPFSTPFTTGTDVGNLAGPYNRATGTGNESSIDGYATGGVPPSNTGVERWPFASPFTIATQVGNLDVSVSSNAGIDSPTDGYSLGGAPFSSTIRRFPFAAPFVTTTSVGSLTHNAYSSAGSNSLTDGYRAGGFTGTPFIPGAPTNRIDSFPFSIPFVTATDIGDLSVAISGNRGLQG